MEQRSKICNIVRSRLHFQKYMFMALELMFCFSKFQYKQKL